MATQTQATGASLRLTRTLGAPRDKVFKAWTDPEALRQWMHPDGHETPVAEVDLRIGGRYRIGMRKLGDDKVFYLTGTYREIQPPARLVYTWRWEAEPAHGETLVTVEFRERGVETDVVLTHEGFPSDGSRDGHNKGWLSCLDSLAAFLGA